MSGSMASITLVGRLTRDAELKYTNAGQAVCHFTIATDARVKKGDQYVEEGSFWEVDLWGKRGEAVNQYLVKGSLVGVSGPVRLEKSEYEGKTYTRARVNAQDLQLLGGKKQEGEGAAQGDSAGAPKPEPRQPQLGEPPRDDFADDIPF